MPAFTKSSHCKLGPTMNLSGRREAPIHCGDWFSDTFIPP
jgi:hypothetical protein